MMINTLTYQLVEVYAIEHFTRGTHERNQLFYVQWNALLTRLIIQESFDSVRVCLKQ